MRIVVSDAPMLKSAIDSIVSLVEEGIFEIKEDGIYLKAMDPSQISMISFKMPKEAFETYEVENPQNIGIEISKLSNILGRGKKGEKAELDIEDGLLTIKFIGNKRKRTFKIHLIELGEGLHKEPKIEFDAHVIIKADVIKDVLKDAKLISTHVRFSVKDKAFVVDVKGEEGEVNAEFEEGSEGIEKIEGKGAKATFPLQYLEDIVKAASSTTPLSIYLATDKPLKVEYEIEGAKATYYLAPRIETE